MVIFRVQLGGWAFIRAWTFIRNFTVYPDFFLFSLGIYFKNVIFFVIFKKNNRSPKNVHIDILLV